MATDAELVQRIKEGDREALGELYARYFPAVWRYANSRMPRDQAAAQDAVSETFLAVMRGIGAFNVAKGTVAGWLLGIAQHKVADRRRMRITMETPNEVVAGIECDPLEERESRERVAVVLEMLDEEERMALEWKYVEGLTVREIAGRMGKTVKAVEALLYRGRQEFRKRYELQDVTEARSGEEHSD